MTPSSAPAVVLSGIADEAGPGIETQLRAHRELGWSAVELRQIDDKYVTVDLADAEFDRARGKILESGLSVSAFASAIGNWSRAITGDFQRDVDELKLAVPRMARLGTRYLRTMSWQREAATETEWRAEAIRRYRELDRIAAGGGIVLLHENCAGWGGQSAHHMRELVETIDSPHVGILFDIGNTISHGYEPWDFYRGIKPHIRYVHVKDCRRNPQGGRSADYTMPGEGDALVRAILGDLLTSGYRGVISIEPHVAAVVHLQKNAGAAARYRAYVDYGRAVERMVADILGHTDAE